MSETSTVLSKIFEGWDGYQSSILHATQLISAEQLTWRPAPNLRSVGELTAHIALGRLGWFVRLQAPGSLELYQQAVAMGWEGAISDRKDEILHWLEMTWRVIADSLNLWTVENLWRTFEQDYQGARYRVSYQWVVWRILAHDIHHGGELAVMLGMLGIDIPELGDLGGHLIMPPVTGT